MIVVIAIVVAWIVILGPSLLRRRATQGDGIASITHFHRQLRILERRAPEPIVAPAYRLRVDDHRAVDAGGRPRLTVVGADNLPRPALAFLAEAPTPAPVPGAQGLAPVPAPRNRDRDRDAEHRLTLRRRRDTLGVLGALTAVTLLIGCLPAARPAWVVTGVGLVALAGYVWLLVRIRRQAELRTHAIPLSAPGGPAGGRDDAYRNDGYGHGYDDEAMAQAWADHPVNQVAVGGR